MFNYYIGLDIGNRLHRESGKCTHHVTDFFLFQAWVGFIDNVTNKKKIATPIFGYYAWYDPLMRINIRPIISVTHTYKVVSKSFETTSNQMAVQVMANLDVKEPRFQFERAYWG